MSTPAHRRTADKTERNQIRSDRVGFRQPEAFRLRSREICDACDRFFKSRGMEVHVSHSVVETHGT